MVSGPLRFKLLLQSKKSIDLPGNDQTLAKLTETGGETLLSFTNSLIMFGIRKSLLYQFTERVIKLAV
jgi:hypothetical protein